MRIPLIFTTVLSVLLIAAMAGGTLLILRQLHDRAAAESAAETVLQRGQTMLSHLVSQTPATGAGTATDWSRFSHLVRNLYTVERGLQYVSVTRDGMVVFHEQTSPPDGTGHRDDAAHQPAAVPGITMHRELLQDGPDRVPVVVFSSDADTTNGTLHVEVALRKEAVSREARAAGSAISSMFRLSLLTVCIAFGLCILLVVLMMRREMRHEALRSEQEHLAFSGMLANGIVHDFRNPMSSLKLDAQMLEKEVGQDGQARPGRIAALAGRMRHTLDRMDEVFKAFLYVSRPDTAERTTIDIAAGVSDAVATLASRLERGRIRVAIKAQDTPLPVTVFAASLRRALVNVITNAIDFSPAGGEISIHMAMSGDHATVEITDQGPGIPPADRQRVFDMFMTTRPEGTGLGLFLARAAIERSGGSIAIADRPPGTGACVRINLPCS
jgi:signal transduction histidine kinase